MKSGKSGNSGLIFFSENRNIRHLKLYNSSRTTFSEKSSYNIYYSTLTIFDKLFFICIYLDIFIIKL